MKNSLELLGVFFQSNPFILKHNNTLKVTHLVLHQFQTGSSSNYNFQHSLPLFFQFLWLTGPARIFQTFFRTNYTFPLCQEIYNLNQHLDQLRWKQRNFGSYLALPPWKSGDPLVGSPEQYLSCASCWPHPQLFILLGVCVCC